jgi:hypothetical protein
MGSGTKKPSAKFIGKAMSFFMKNLNGSTMTVMLSPIGELLVTEEPNFVDWHYIVWGEFERDFPDLAQIMKQESIASIQEGIQLISKVQAAQMVSDLQDRMYV